MKTVLRRFEVALCLSALLVGSFMPGGCSRDNRVDKDTLVVLEGSDASTLNPIFTVDAASYEAESLIFEPLILIGPGFRFVPWLATSWHGSADHLHWTVHLRHDVQWSDGVPFTSADVAWTWKAQLDPATGVPFLGQYGFLKRVYATDRFTVIFDLKEPNVLFVPEVLGTNVVPKHILGKYPDSDLRKTDFNEHPIGTGPYILDGWKHDEHIAFRRNLHWWHGTPHIRRIMLRDVFLPDAMVEAMKSGEAHAMDGIEIDSSSVAELKETRGVRIVKVPSLGVGFDAINHRRPGLNDNRVLQAMMYGWDREAVAKNLDRGSVAVATGIEPPVLNWYDPHVTTYPYNPRKARAILDAAGYRVGRDGIRSGHGIRLAYTFTISGRQGLDADYAAEFQADMRNIGIGITNQITDYSLVLDMEEAGKFDIVEEEWGNGNGDPDMFALLDSSQVPPTGNNFMRYKDAEVDHDLRAGLATFDLNKRQALYDDFQRETAMHLPFLFSFYASYYVALSSRIEGSRIIPGSLFYNIGDWRLAP